MLFIVQFLNKLGLYTYRYRVGMFYGHIFLSLTILYYMNEDIMKDKVFSIRMSKQEMESLRLKSRRYGFTSCGEFLRWMIKCGLESIAFEKKDTYQFTHTFETLYFLRNLTAFLANDPLKSGPLHLQVESAYQQFIGCIASHFHMQSLGWFFDSAHCHTHFKNENNQQFLY